MKNVAIVLAGGMGKRMNSDVPKQYMELDGYPVLYYTLSAFQNSFFDKIILVTRKGDEEYCRTTFVDKYNFYKVKHIIAGGEERYNSVMNGLKKVGSDCGYVYIHDGARPFVDNAIFDRMREALKTNDACIAAVAAKDTIKVVNESMEVIDTPDRKTLYQVQTPQAFELKLIVTAYARLEKDMVKFKNISITDDAMVVERYTDAKVKVVEGSYNNIKITSPEDLIVGENIIRSLVK